MFQGLIAQPLFYFFSILPPSLAPSLKWQKIVVWKIESAGKNMTYKVSLAVWGYHGQGGDAVPPCMGTEDFLAGGRADVTQGSPALVCRVYLSRLQYLERSHPVKRCVGTRACPESPGAAGSRPHPCLHVAKQLQAGKRAVRLASFVQALARTSLGSLNALISP